MIVSDCCRAKRRAKKYIMFFIGGNGIGIHNNLIKLFTKVLSLMGVIGKEISNLYFVEHFKKSVSINSLAFC